MTTFNRYDSVLVAPWEHIAHALAGRPLILVDRFGGAGRTWAHPYTLRPALTLSLYDSWPAATGHSLLALEQRTRRRDNATRHHWLDLLEPEAAQILAELDEQPALYSWYETPTLRRLVLPRQGTIVAYPERTVATLENKTIFGHIMRSAGVDRELWVDSIVLNRRPPLFSFDVLRKRLDTDTLVIQAAHGSGGRGTVFVRSAAEFEAATITLPVRASAFVPGPSSNITVLTLPNSTNGCSIYMDLPSFKGIGIAALGVGTAKSAGNDWSIPRAGSDITRLIEAVDRLGQWAYRTHRLFGLWGVDVIWSPAGPQLNEINPRIQGTTETSSGNQLIRNLPPLILGHLAALLGIYPRWLPTADEFNTETVQLAALTGRTAPFYLKVRATKLSTGATDFPGSGAYNIGPAGSLTWLRSGATALDANLDHDEILIANAALSGTVCEPGSEVATLEGTTSQPIFTKCGTDLSPAAMLAVAAARAAMGRP